MPHGGAPPGMQQIQSQQPGRPGALPPNFQPPANMNFNAPVIRLGTGGSGRAEGRQPSGPDTMVAGPRRGLGMGSGTEQQRQQIRESMMAMAPPSREEVARTIFVGNITDGVGGDEGLERILRTAGGLRRWTRATDQSGKPCKFGFAEYEDAESLETAIEIFQNIEIPVKRPIANGSANENGDSEVEKTVLLVGRRPSAVAHIITYPNNVYRLSSMKHQRSMLQTGKQSVMRLKRQSSSGSMVPAKV